MCKFFRCLITKDRVYWNRNTDSHEDIITMYRLKDNEVDLVRVELLPIDGDVFNLNRENWKLEIDQDILPVWFEKSLYEDEVFKAFSRCVENAFLIGKERRVINSGRWFIKDSKISYICGNAKVEIIDGNSEVLMIGDDVRVNTIKGNTEIEEIQGDVFIHNIQGSSIVNSISGYVFVGSIKENTKVNFINGNARIGDICENAEIVSISHNAYIHRIYGNVIIHTINGYVRVKFVERDVKIDSVSGNACVGIIGEDVFSEKGDKYGVVINEVSGNSFVDAFSGTFIERVLGNAVIRAYKESEVKSVFEDAVVIDMRNHKISMHLYPYIGGKNG